MSLRDQVGVNLKVGSGSENEKARESKCERAREGERDTEERAERRVRVRE